MGSMGISKSATPSTLQEPGGEVTYTVTVTNTSSNVDLSVMNVVDDFFGDLDDDGGNGCFDVPINLAPGAHASCQFTGKVTGAGGTSHVNTVTAYGHDENGHELTASAQARVDTTERLIDLVLTKAATSPTPLGGTVHYSLSVTNQGADPATNVEIADPAPAGISFVGATTTQGTCSVTASLASCSVGTLAPGQTVTVSITAKATQVGSIVNSATATGSGGRETNATDNVAQATTEVPAPVTPPTPETGTKSHTSACLTLTVSPKMVTADHQTHRIMISVTASGTRVRGAKVVIRGAGVRTSGRTNRSGVAVVRVKPVRSGVITITANERRQESCGAKRVAVTGAFVPPVTG
jgi:uncharacterized repeat protein (TIGR01451 family)